MYLLPQCELLLIILLEPHFIIIVQSNLCFGDRFSLLMSQIDNISTSPIGNWKTIEFYYMDILIHTSYLSYS